jgi:anti-sigma factor RsiW
MAGEKRDRARSERLERTAAEVVRASAAGEAEAEQVSESPFLYARVRARIEGERRRREEGDGWLGLLAVALRAAPAMGLAAVAALALFLSSGASERAQVSGFGLGEALLAERDGDIEQVVFEDARAPSSDEVLSTIIGGGESEAAR